MDEKEFNELVDRTGRGRVFAQARRVALADCSPTGRMRLDALARWLQDVAYEDVDDAGLAAVAVWVVRRTRMQVARFPRFGERFTVQTFCSGIGAMWAERRTTITRFESRDADVEAVSLWVHLEPVSRRPAPFSDAEVAVYAEAASERRIRARLRHPPPGSAADSAQRMGTWGFRATECDIAGHVNNAAYWEPIEEELLGAPEPERLDAEMEYRTPSQPGEKLILGDGGRRWILNSEGEVHASVLMVSG